MFDEMTQRNASKYLITLEYENRFTFPPFFHFVQYFFPLIEMPEEFIGEKR